jgi:cell division protein FtsI (penicillin-binding protein 3)
LNPEFVSETYFKVKSGFSQRKKKRNGFETILRIFQWLENRNSGELRKAGGVGKYYASSFVGYFPAEEPNIRV